MSDTPITAVAIVDYDPFPEERFKCNWALYSVVARMSDGTERTGYCQGDTHAWALETFEEAV